MRKRYSQDISHLALIASALITYILAENIGGNGVIAVTTAGLLFGSVYVKEKAHLMEFSSLLVVFLEILVFVLVGLLIEIPFDIWFYVKSITLFLIYITIRFISVYMTFIKSDYNIKEKIFMSLIAPKGIAVAVVTSSLILMNIAELKQIFDLILVFILYSILVASIALALSKFFIRATVVKPLTTPSVNKRSKK